MSDVNRRYFESLMQDRELSLRGLAQRMGMSHSQLSLTFSGARKLQIEEAAQLSSLFGRPIHEIIENAGVPVRTMVGQRVSVIGAMMGDGTVELNEDDAAERTTAPEGIQEDGAAVQARTAGTPLEWLDGAVFFFARPDDIDPAALGRLCYCRIKDGPAVMASVRRGYRDGTWNLRGPYHADSVRLEVAAVVLTTRN